MLNEAMFFKEKKKGGEEKHPELKFQRNNISKL